MPRFTYTGEPERYYPTLGLAPEPGSSHDLDEDPGDGRWTAAPSTRKAAAPAAATASDGE